MKSFNPNRSTLAKCIAQLKELGADAGIDRGRILTSQDVGKMGLNEKLDVENIPGGFRKSILPVFLEKASTFYFSQGEAGADVPEHSHDEGDGLRVIMSGSIRYGDRELKAGDWMFLPAGQRYSFTVGDEGVSMFYCYSCCCA